MTRRIYHAKSLDQIDLDELANRLPSSRVVVGIDVAKKRFYAVLRAQQEEVLETLSWDGPQGSRRWIDWMASQPVQWEVALEPSGTYGDSLREQLRKRGIPVYRALPKWVWDAREIFDGVPSSHDAKCASSISWLHWIKRTRPWPRMSESRRELRAAIQLMMLYGAEFRQTQNRLEALLARYWPELPKLLELDSASLLELLSQYGGPKEAAQGQLEPFLRSVSRGNLSDEKIEQIETSAADSQGVAMVEGERKLLQTVAREGRRQQKSWQAARARVRQLAEKEESLKHWMSVVGVVTSAVLLTSLGDLRDYQSPRSLLKAAGLNLKERSSGIRKGQLAITKRGPGRVRQYLYLAALRWIQRDPLVRRWYDAKVARDGGRKRRAIVALMRKLLTGLWWAAQGQAFRSSKLFHLPPLKPAAKVRSA